MPLTEIAVRNAKPGAKPLKLFDGKGLFLLVQPAGGKLWRLKYRVAGKEKKLSLGRYPEVSLKEARKRCDEARAKIETGTDPAEERKLAAAAAILSQEHSFDAVGREFIEKLASEGREQVTLEKARWLLSLLAPALGHRPVAEIKPAELLAALKKVETKGHFETARRMRSLASRVFRFAIATSRAELNPADSLKGALVAPKVKHRSAIINRAEFAALLKEIDDYQGHPHTMIALKLTPHLFVRPGELRHAEWPEIELDQKVWTIPGEKMKMRRPHRVPLSSQSVALFREIYPHSCRQRYVFATLYPGERPMSENTINSALRRMGYSGAEMTAHGFRASASTMLNESGRWSVDAIERALAHYESGSVRSAYHRGEHWDERVAMAQWWSDQLDRLKAGQ